MAKRWCVWVSYKGITRAWSPYRLVATFVHQCDGNPNHGAKKMAIYFSRKMFRMGDGSKCGWIEDRVLPEGRKPRRTK